MLSDDPGAVKIREYRKKVGNVVTHRYEKTKKGFLMRLYRNMKSRIEGVQKKKHHLYIEKELLDKDEFYSWALASEEFHRLFGEWEKAEHPRKLSPSVDRMDSSKGYVVGNMEWVTHSENSRRGGLVKKKNNCKNI